MPEMDGRRVASRPPGRARRIGMVVGVVVISFFFLAMVAGGAWLAYVSVRQIRTARASVSWVSTPAELLDYQVRHTSSRTGGRTDITCTYTYEFDGRRYPGNRVAQDLDGSGVEVGRWRQNLIVLLKRAEESDRVITCYVNPDDPAEATLIRDEPAGGLALTAWLAIVVIAMGVTFTLYLAGKIVMHVQAIRWVDDQPYQPWMWLPCWRQQPMVQTRMPLWPFWLAAAYLAADATLLVTYVLPVLSREGGSGMA